MDKDKLKIFITRMKDGYKNKDDFIINMSLSHIHVIDGNPQGGFIEFWQYVNDDGMYIYEEDYQHHIKGMRQIEQALSIDHPGGLSEWARENPDIWGNCFGCEWSYSSSAYTGKYQGFWEKVDNPPPITPETIIMHFENVLKRLGGKNEIYL